MPLFDLDRFVAAQDGVLDAVHHELRAGQKSSHWMWFIFPQLAGLGHSATARHYAIAGAAEARAYGEHPLLGARLLECTALVGTTGRSISRIFGSPDDLKFHSSMTLFARAWPRASMFRQALARYFDGEEDARTITLLTRSQTMP